MKPATLNPEVIKKIQEQKQSEKEQNEARVEKTDHWFNR